MLNNEKINFASENYAGVHDQIMNALIEANTGAAPSYGNDQYTKDAIATLKTHFGQDIDVYFTFNGTGANNFGIGSVASKYHAVFCTDVAHLYVDESAAPEAFIGCRIYPVNSVDGKMIPQELESKLKRIGDVHHPQPKVVTLTQPTEYGTVYTLDELKVIKDICTKNDLVLHVDGARFFCAAVYLNKSLKQISADAGVDILTLGGTKSGMMFGEAVIFFNQAIAGAHKFDLKRSMQLASKNRFIAAQFKAMLAGDLWKNIAEHTNMLAKNLKDTLLAIPSIELTHPVETNAVFITLPKSVYEQLQQFTYFYCWNEDKNEYRLIVSPNTMVAEITVFTEKLKLLMGEKNRA